MVHTGNGPGPGAAHTEALERSIAELDEADTRGGRIIEAAEDAAAAASFSGAPGDVLEMLALTERLGKKRQEETRIREDSRCLVQRILELCAKSRRKAAAKRQSAAACDSRGTETKAYCRTEEREQTEGGAG